MKVKQSTRARLPLTVEKIDFDTYVGVPGSDFGPYTSQEADGHPGDDLV